jgi:hypothetical protein
MGECPNPARRQQPTAEQILTLQEFLRERQEWKAERGKTEPTLKRATFFR